MDSLTQMALGAAVTVAVMGRRTAAWKAAAWGALAGTLPDLDAFIDHGDAVLNMTLHRADSHSLLWLTLGAPVLAWIVSRWQGEATLFKRWWLALWLALFTHPLLDTMTVYGTQLLRPFTDHPFAVGSVFIIDPAYTLPLLVGLIAAMAAWRGQGLRWNLAGLALSTLYLGWSLGAQQWATVQARSSLAEAGIEAERLLVTPAPFNTVLWRLVAMTPESYFEGHVSLLDNGTRIRWTEHSRGAELEGVLGEHDAVRRVAAFSHGFYSLTTLDGGYQVTDLRMGQEPSYTFRFEIDPQQPERPAVMAGARPDLGVALPWLWQRLRGLDVPSPGALALGEGPVGQPPGLSAPVR